MRTALIIAGSDSSGGAGIQADIKTMTAHRVYAMSAVTALTAQNTCGVSGIMEVPPEFLEKQIAAIVTDIFPDAVKIGMTSSSALIRVIVKSIKIHGLKNIVVDPVMLATSGSKLISDGAISVLQAELLPAACLVTPNIPEAEIFSGIKILSSNDMEQAARIIFEKFGCSVLCKGGHSVNDADDYLFTKTGGHWFKGKRIDNPNTHGTGCTLSSAIASNLAKGLPLKTAVEKAKCYIWRALAAMLDLGQGRGPMNHAFDITGEYLTCSETEAAEKKLLQAKEHHRQKMEAQNKCIADLKKLSDFEKCLWWKENGCPQPSGDDIVRIKNETGLSWTEFKKMVSEF